MANILESPSDQKEWNIPMELWGIVIDQPLLCHADLKQIRFVCSAFLTYATPRLFDQITISLVPENVKSLKHIVDKLEFAKCVRTIKLDNTLYNFSPNPTVYSELAQQYFEGYLGPQDDGPFSARRLSQLFLAMPSTPLSPLHLNNPLREDFIRGYALYQGRMEYRKSFERGPALRRLLSEIITPLVNVNSIELYHGWEFKLEREESKRTFKAYLLENLEPEVRSLVNGSIHEDMAASTTTVPLDLSMFVAPGPAARNHNPMWVPPEYPPRSSSHVPDALVTQLLHILPTTTLQIDSFKLPANARLGQKDYRVGVPDHVHYIHPAVLVGRPEMNRSTSNNFLVPMFAKLKYLDLKFDAVRLSRSTNTIYNYNATGITKGVQALRMAEELVVAFREDEPQQQILTQDIFTQSWSVGELFLVGLVPVTTEEDSSSQGLDSDGKLEFYDALPVNKWPKLRVITLANMTASFSDINILFKTIAPSLRELELWQIRLDGSCKNCREHCLLRVDHEGKDTCMDWVDVAVSLRSILSLQRCVIDLAEGDFTTIQKRMGWQVGGKGEVEILLGRWLVGERGEGTSDLMQFLENS